MVRRYLAPALLVAVVLFVWGFVSHAVLPWHDPVWHRFTDEETVSRTLAEHAPQGGLYYLPHASADRELHPLEALVHVLPASDSREDSRRALLGLLVNVLTALLVLTFTRGVPGPGARSCVVTFATAGLLIGFPTHAYYWVWFGFPAEYLGIMTVDAVAGWGLAGMVLGVGRASSLSAPSGSPR